MKTFISTALLGFFFLALFHNANAQFIGDFDPVHWESDYSQGGSIFPDANQVVLTGGDGSGDLLYTIIPNSDFLVSFTWQYSTTDDAPHWDPAFYVIDGVEYQLPSNNGPLDQGGSIENIFVSAGSVFGFVQRSDGCCGEGTLTISNFGAEGVDVQQGGGTSCQLAYQVDQGTIYQTPALQNASWYRYTMPDLSNQKMVLYAASDVLVQVLRGSCVDNILIGSEFGGGDQVVFTDLQPNEELLFVFFNYSGQPDFEWFFNLEQANVGESCSNAITANVGDNAAVITANSTAIWYSYTMPVGKKVVINSNSNESIQILSGECTDPDYHSNSWSNLEVTGVEPGQPFFIKWTNTNTNQNFTWTLSEEDYVQGDLCSNALPASTGLNSTSVDGGEVWYSYTMPPEANKKLVITSDVGGYVQVMTANCDNADSYGFGFPNVGLTNLSPNEEILIRWITYSGVSTLEWELATADILTGESCLIPKPVNTSSPNIVPFTSVNAYWYSFTMPPGNDRKLVVTSTSQNNFLVMAGTCDDHQDHGFFYENGEITSLSPGESGFIRWDTYNGGDFPFSVSFVDFAPGESCTSSIPIDPTVNSGNVTVSSALDEVWYNITFPANQKLVLSSATSHYVEYFTGPCGSINSQNGDGNGNFEASNFVEGQSILIHWYPQGASFDFNVSFEDLDPGEGCSTATTAVVGANQLVSNGLETYVYSFTMPQGSAKKLIITSAYLNGVGLYRGSCGQMEFASEGYSGVDNADLAPGETIFISWDVLPSSNFSWQLALQDIEPGDNCAMAITAVEGNNNNANVPPKWFTFTMPGTGDITISSFGHTNTDTYLKIYESCGSDEPLAQSDDFGATYQSTVTLTNLGQGTLLKILWDDVYSNEAFPWSITLSNLVTAQEQTITFLPIAAKSFGEGSFNLGATSDSNLPVSYLSSNPDVATISGNSVTILGVGTTEITASQPGNEDYLPATSVVRTLTVNKGNQLISFNPLTAKAAGDASFGITASSTSGLPVTFESSNQLVATVVGNIVTIVGAGSTTITATQAGSGNYNAATPVEQILLVKVNQSITFEPLPAKGIGDVPFNLTAAATSGLPVTFESSDPTIASVSGNTVTIHKVGTVTITAYQFGNTTHSPASPIGQVLTINKTTQEITFNPLPVKVIGDVPFNLTATATSGLLVTFESADPTIASINENTLTIHKTGSVTISAKQLGDNIYNPANTVEQILTINKKEQQIFFAPIANKTFGDLAFDPGATSSSTLPISYQISNQALGQIIGNTIVLLAHGLITITAYQDGNDEFFPAVPVSQTFCVNPPPPVIIATFIDADAPVLTSSSLVGNQWYRNGVAIEGANEVTYEVTNAGEFQVTTNAQTCTSGFSEAFTVLITDIASEEQIALFPNPATEEILIQGIQESSSVRVFSSSGIEYRTTSTWLHVENKRIVTVSELSSGVYTLLIMDQGKIKHIKFIKQ